MIKMLIGLISLIGFSYAESCNDYAKVICSDGYMVYLSTCSVTHPNSNWNQEYDYKAQPQYKPLTDKNNNLISCKSNIK